jgi:tRNA pseudouridine55 synthase
MHGVLVVDKPQGLTSHDVVAVARRLLGESRIGHTGTLDPLATGVLPLAIGRATRLVRFLSSSDKDYDATIRFGVTTDTYDVTGTETSRTGRAPDRDALLRALDALRGDYMQAPPAYSAKKVQGKRAYDLARAQQSVMLASVPVRVARVELLEFAQFSARVTLTCSAGFYVRSFAAALGELTGTGAALEALRRTRSGEFSLQDAIGLDALDEGRGASRILPMEALLRSFPAVTLTPLGREHVAHGRELAPQDFTPSDLPDSSPATFPLPSDPFPEWTRLFDPEGALVGVATGGTRPGSLHPSLVLI